VRTALKANFPRSLAPRFATRAALGSTKTQRPNRLVSPVLSVAMRTAKAKPTVSIAPLVVSPIS
jgi:hypothetical protein